MTDTNLTRTADRVPRDGPPMPPSTPDNPFPTPWPGGPTYDEYHLLGEVVTRFELQGQLPPESVPKDIEGALNACRSLLRSLGLHPRSAVAA